MSAAPHLSLLLETEQSDQRRFLVDPAERCRFCNCTDESPCAIPLREEDNGNFYLARTEQETTLLIPCSWFIPRVCSKPECIEKLLLEARGKVVLFDALGKQASR